MKRVIFYLLTLSIAFQVAISQGEDDIEDKFWDFGDIEEKENMFKKRYANFNDGAPDTMTPNALDCYKFHIRCLRKGEGGMVCTHNYKYGLVQFSSACDVYLQNCLITATRVNPGQKKVTYFYNGHGRDCKYYLTQAYTVADAVKLYYLVDKARRRMIGSAEDAPEELNIFGLDQTTTENPM